jgi:purine-binding chemotaxis protein CheW
VHDLAGAPAFVSGLATIRGAAVPVVDVAAAIGQPRRSSNAARFVALKIAGRRVALAVDEVVDVRRIDRARLADAPPLLGAAREHVASTIGTLDAELLLVLQSGTLVPESIWTALEADGRQ